MNPWIIVAIVAVVIAIFIVAIRVIKKESKKAHYHHHIEEFVPNESLPVNENFLLYMQEYARDNDFLSESKDALQVFFEKHIEEMKLGYIKLSPKSVLIMGPELEKDLIKKAVESYRYGPEE